MNDEAPRTGVRWWDWKPLIRSALMGLAFYGVFWALAKKVEPPEGYVFERLPTINGIYKCCAAGGRYSQSWVGSSPVNCLGFSYYHIGTGRNDCGFKEKLNGLVVEAEQVLIPAYNGPLPLASRITSSGQIFYERNDQQIRELWISGSNGDASTLGWWAFLIVHFIQLVYSSRQFKKSERAKA